MPAKLFTPTRRAFPFRIREVLAWHKDNTHLPRGLYRILDEARPLVAAATQSQEGLSNHTREKLFDSALTSAATTGMENSRARDLQNRVLRLKARVEEGNNNFHSQKGYATQPLGADHLERLRTHLSFIVGHLSKAERKRVEDSLSYGHIPLQDVTILISLLRQAIEASSGQPFSWQEGKEVRSAAWPGARAYIPLPWAVHTERLISGGFLSEEVSGNAVKHQILLALDLYAADQLASGINTLLVHFEQPTSRTPQKLHLA
ncbi:hypothetical protein ACI3L1_19635 [Deinococcus sp. SM5_A1]|uniref:hypothetical protein n=1 Tax=Deinococcus sp. SM5_A1 TaxID=3379094 RepID=UPI003858E4CC